MIDAHSDDFVQPEEDEQQDVALLSVELPAGGNSTVAVVTRPLVTCDPDDMAVMVGGAAGRRCVCVCAPACSQQKAAGRSTAGQASPPRAAGAGSCR